MDYQQFKEAVLAAAKTAGLTEYELYSEMEMSSSVDAFDHKIEKFASAVAQGVNFRCVVNNKPGYCSTEKLSAEEAERIVAKAICSAQVVESEDPVFLHDPSEDENAVCETSTSKAEKLPPTEKMMAAALELEKDAYAQDPRISKGTQAELSAQRLTVRIANSKGLDREYTAVGNMAYLSVLAEENGEKFQIGDYCMGKTLEDMPLKKLAQTGAKKATDNIGATTVDSGMYSIVLENRMAFTLLETFSSIFSSENAQNGMSLLADREGEKIASEVLTITDDPSLPQSPAQVPFDGEGVTTFCKNVVEKGVLKTLLYNLKTAAKAGNGQKTTGNAARGGGSITVAPCTLYIQAGDFTPEQILEQAGDGILITEIKGTHAGANPISGDFSLESRGFRIRNGKRTEAVTGFTIAGNIFEMFQKIKAVGNDLTFSLSSGKTAFGAPSVLVEGVSVAGKNTEE